jgi:response regulator RpfG family c-di-GMP phosphodiesterase
MVCIIGLVTMAIVYVVERQNLRSLVIEETRIEIQLLISRTLQLSKETGNDRRAAFRQALEERLAVRLKRDNGEFVYVCFYAMNTPDVEERLASNYALIDPVVHFIRSHPPSVPETGEWSEILMLGGKAHVYVIMPVEAPSLQNKVYARAIFAPSETARVGIEKKLRRSIILAILIVLATSGLLYPVILHLVRKLTVFSRNLLDANLEALSLLASTIAKRDSDTDVHNFRVTLYSVRLAEALQLPDSVIQTLIKGAFLHDVGKIGIRDTILLKPGGLDAEEFSLMKDHVQHGMDIISSSIWLNDAAQVVGSHHEKFDGSGYPQGTTGETIPLLARIFAIADVFDALASKRPYKEPLSCPASLAVLQQGRGSHFDPTILDAFMIIAQELYRTYAGRDDQGLRDELRAVITQYFSSGEIVLY